MNFIEARVTAIVAQVGELPVGSEKVFSFWVGMQLSAQLRVLAISTICPTVEMIAVFQDRKWKLPDSRARLII